MTRPVHTVTPSGEPIVILSAEEYRRLLARSRGGEPMPGPAAEAIWAADPIVPAGAPAFPAAVPVIPTAKPAPAPTAPPSGTGSTLSAAEAVALREAAMPLTFWRKKRGLSQRALADRIGVTQPYLNHLESGKRRGTVQTFQKLAAALEIDIKDLVGDGAKAEAPT